MRVEQHRLVEGGQVAYVESPNKSGHGRLKPLYLVLHFTAGGSTEGAVEWFLNPAAKASAHVLIGRDGKVIQMVPFDCRAWHAGVSRWGELEGLNAYSIGIELVNWGRLSKSAGGKWRTWSKAEIDAGEVTIARHRHEPADAGWHEYTPAQIESLIQVATALHAAYEFTDILGHDDIAPGRKTDPGPLLPLGSIRSRVLGRE
jgi:N-acetylmuramoyl-L-alanine amidase